MQTSPWRLLNVLTGVVFAILVIFLAWKVQKSVENVGLERAKNVASDVASKISLTAGIAESEVAASKALFAASEKVTEDEFQTFIASSGLLDSVQKYRAIAVMPVFRRDQLEAMNAELARRSKERETLGYLPVKITDDPARDIFMPVLYVESNEGRDGILGYDIATDPIRLRVASIALRDEAILATPPVILSQDSKTDQTSVLIFAGIQNANLGFRNSNRENDPSPTILAFSYSPSIVIESVFLPANEREFLFKVIDVTDGASDLLYSDTRIEETLFRVCENTITFMNREWLVAVYTDAEPAAWAFWSSWWLVAIGVLLTGAVVASVDRLIIGRDVLVAGVASATADLGKANLKLAESARAAEAANRAKSEFLANMSHELRSPLNSIIGFSQLIATEAFGPAGHKNYQEYGTLIQRAGLHQLALVNDILDIASIEAGRSVLSVEQIDPTIVIAECVDLFQVEAAKNHVSIELHFDDEPIVADVDVRSLRQILINLISNAVKFSPKDGKITVSLRLGRGSTYVISVSDQGPGIAENEIDLVLEPFGQVRQDSMIAHPGVGLGLPIAKRLSEVHGGALGIDSAPNGGARVWVELPLKVSSTNAA